MITESYIAFFKALKQHNNKEWFHANKKTYEKEVKQPFLALLETLIPMLQQLEPTIAATPKEALFRINRDLRFSADKTPYHTLLKAGFAPGGKKSALPGYYLGISAEKVHVGGGLFQLKGPALKQVRTQITHEPDALNNIVDAPLFVNTFGKLKGELSKRLDQHFQPTLKITPYIAHKQFYAMQEVPLKDYIHSDRLVPLITDAFKAIHPLNQYLKKAFE